MSDRENSTTIDDEYVATRRAYIEAIVRCRHLPPEVFGACIAQIAKSDREQDALHV